MALPALKRTSIRTAVANALKLILAGSSYHTDLGKNVFTWRPLAKKFQESEIPGCNIEDKSTDVARELTGGSTNLWRKELTLLVGIVCHDIATYDKCVADVYKAIEADPTLGGLAIDVTSAGDAIDVDEEERLVQGGVVSLMISYSTNRMEI